jgi:hypothetical protein
MPTYMTDKHQDIVESLKYTISRRWGDGGRSPTMTLDRPDRFFLTDGMARGRPISELAGFLNRSEDEIKSYLTRSSSSVVAPARDSHPRSTS